MVGLDEEEGHNTTKTMEAEAESNKKGFGTVPMIVVAIGAAVLFFSLLLLFLWRRTVLRERRLQNNDDSEYSASSSFEGSDDPDGPSFDSDVSWDDTVAHNGEGDEHSVELGTA
eukprot:scaffold42615_cov55-Attheya_sp.AAC.1